MQRHITSFAALLMFVSGAATADSPDNFEWTAPDGQKMTATTTDFAGWVQNMRAVPGLSSTIAGYMDLDDGDANRNHVPDAAEIELIRKICDNSAHSLHHSVHEAFKRNVLQLGGTVSAPGDLGASVIAEAAPLKFIVAAYVCLGDGEYGRDPFYALGSWGACAGLMYLGMPQGTKWALGAPNEANYTRLPDILSACGDADGDGVSNVREWYYAPQSSYYVARALNEKQNDDGGDPYGVCGAVVFGVTHFYDALRKQVYYLSEQRVPWSIAAERAATVTVPGSGAQAQMAEIGSAEENTFIFVNIVNNLDDSCWLGGSDAESEGVWRWVESATTFWQSGETSEGSYSNWAPGEPGNQGHLGEEDYLTMQWAATWNDINGVRSFASVLEFPGEYPDTDVNGTPDAWQEKVNPVDTAAAAELGISGMTPTPEGETTPTPKRGCFRDDTASAEAEMPLVGLLIILAGWSAIRREKRFGKGTDWKG